MKFIVVEFPDDTDISTLVAGASVAVGVSGGSTLVSGTVDFVGAGKNDTPILVRHKHPLPAGETGDAVAVP